MLIRLTPNAPIASVDDMPTKAESPHSLASGSQPMRVVDADQLVTVGSYYQLAWAVDVAMCLDIEAQSRYREIYGRDWEPVGCVR